MSDEKRPYRKQRRAELEARTRERITESTVHLHGTLGPARTTVSAIAEHAGVRRSTVYRHFPDDAALFDACTAHWAARNPVPDLEGWAAIEDPQERLGSALSELYAFYGSTEAMLANLYRDEPTLPLVAERFAAFRGYLDAARDLLATGRRQRAAAGHALAFATWRSLVREQGVSDAEAVELMTELVAGSETTSRRGRG